MELHRPTSADGERIVELVESSMTTSYRLSPQQIERITAAEFAEAALDGKVENQSTIVRVAATDDEIESATIVGYVEGSVDEEWGELNWLFVDPEHRGKGIGEQLYETAVASLREAGAEKLRATALETNTDGHQFLEHVGLERAGDRRIDVGDESLVKYVYAEPVADVGTDENEHAEWGEGENDLPGTETTDGTRTAETGDGRELFVARDQREPGTKAPFFVTYTDEAHTEQFGYYCGNCGSVDVTMDSVDRVQCQECGNDQASRSTETYDDSYL